MSETKYIIEAFFAGKWSRLENYTFYQKDTAKRIYDDHKINFPAGKFRLIEVKERVIA
jgi:hypothetical protein